MDLLLRLLVRYHDPNPTPSCAPSSRDGRTTSPLTPYPRRLLEHASIRLVSMRSKPPNSTALMACASQYPLPYHMLSVLMEGPGGSGAQWCGGNGTMCRKPAPYEFGQEEVINILAEAKKERKTRKSPVLATVGSISIIFWITPLSINGRGQQVVGCGGDGI